LAALSGQISDIDPQPALQPATWEGGWPQTIGEFERLVGVFQDRLVRYAFRRLSDFHEAEDVAQEVFVRAYAERERLKTIARVGPYLYRMAANLCTDILRKRRTGVVPFDDPEVQEIPTTCPNGSEVASAAEELRRIETTLSRLPHRQAEVIRLRVFDELRLGEIAEVLRCPLATVKSRFRYGLEKLRAIVLREWRE